jgi:DNA-binding MarR family transcriptional regulator
MVGQRLGPDLFVTPAWDMLLDLYADDQRQPMSLTGLCGASHVPERSGLRTIEDLVERKLLVRLPDARDRRRTNVHLSGRAIRLLNGYFDDLLEHMRSA